MEKTLTNEQMLRRLVLDLSPYEAMIVRERIVKIAEITLADIEKEPTAYDNPIFNHEFYVIVCNKIFKYCGFEKHKKEVKK